MAAHPPINIVAGTSQRTRVVIEHGVVAPLMQLLSYTNDDEIKEEVYLPQFLGIIALSKAPCMCVAVFYTISMSHVLNRHYGH